MEARTIYISAYDKKRMLKLISRSSPGNNSLKELSKELDRAQVVNPEEMPGNVITMNSRVRLKDIDSGEEMEYTLVFPEDADFKQKRISILAPVGTALIGYSVGDIIEWQVPKGIRKLQVEELLYQPEAAGDYEL